jgi:hypothetical protein
MRAVPFASPSWKLNKLGRKNIPKKVRRKTGYRGTSQYERVKTGKFLKQAKDTVRRYQKENK